MISAIEKPKKPSLKVIRKNNELLVNEAPKLLYTVIVNNRLQKKEPENNPEEIGLPPQPQQYLRYPDYDWL